MRIFSALSADPPVADGERRGFDRPNEVAEPVATVDAGEVHVVIELGDSRRIDVAVEDVVVVRLLAGTELDVRVRRGKSVELPIVVKPPRP